MKWVFYLLAPTEIHIQMLFARAALRKDGTPTILEAALRVKKQDVLHAPIFALEDTVRSHLDGILNLGLGAMPKEDYDGLFTAAIECLGRERHRMIGEINAAHT